MTIYSHIEDDDLVYKALANTHRRRMMDIVATRPGIAQQDLAEQFSMSRFGVAKHIDVLEEAGLLTTEMKGRERRHWLNAVPIRLIHDRWLSEQTSKWAAALSSLKHRLETMEKPVHRYQLFIRTTPEALWNALTSGEVTPMYYYRARLRTTLEPGSPFEYYHHDKDQVLITGEVIEVVPKKRLVHSFDFMKGDGPSRVTWDMEELGDVCKLTLTHEFEREDQTWKDVQNGWNPILSGLKTLLETGEELPIPMGDT